MDRGQQEDFNRFYLNFIIARAKNLTSELERIPSLPAPVKQHIRSAMFQSAVKAIGELNISVDPGTIPDLARILKVIPEESSDPSKKEDVAGSDLPEDLLSHFTNFSI